MERGWDALTLQAAEEYARARGGYPARAQTSLDSNTVARHLYDAVGYQVVSTQMLKDLRLTFLGAIQRC